LPEEPARKAAQPLGHELGGDGAEAGHIAARPREARDKAHRDRIAAVEEDDRDCRGLVFRREHRSITACGDHINLAADEISGQRG